MNELYKGTRVRVVQTDDGFNVVHRHRILAVFYTKILANAFASFADQACVSSSDPMYEEAQIIGRVVTMEAAANLISDVLAAAGLEKKQQADQLEAVARVWEKKWGP